MNSCRRLSEVHKNILDHVLSNIGVISQSDSQLEQIVFVLVIDPAQGICIAELESPDKQPVFRYLAQRIRERSFFIHNTPPPSILV